MNKTPDEVINFRFLQLAFRQRVLEQVVAALAAQADFDVRRRIDDLITGDLLTATAAGFPELQDRDVHDLIDFFAHDLDREKGRLTRGSRSDAGSGPEA
ncbi:hypothetical protein LDL36_03170 [Komagataeibacter sp. FNDCR1]|nr:hypothetical protein [Komagataeibacter sp. FNDCR1]